MPSKKTKQIAKQGLQSVPVHPIKFTLNYELKDPKGIESITKENKETGEKKIVWIADLPTSLTMEINITQLKGWQYAPEWLQIEEEYNLSLYKCKSVQALSRSGEKVDTSFLAITSGVGQMNFMLNNAVKLYLLPTENKLATAIQDRNYSEIVGTFQFEEDEVHNAVLSTTMSSSMKTEIKEIRDKCKIRDKEILAQSPLRKTSLAIGVLVSNEKLANYRAEEKALRQKGKIFLLKAK
jgi:hypothetical protein